MPWVVPAKVLKVVDGDTMDVEIYPWLDTVLKVRVRLARVDCDELHAKTEAKRISAKKATEFTSKQVLTGGIRLAPLGKDSFGRVLGEIFYKVGDKEYNLSDRLLEEGLAMKGYSPERF
jgi:endonuclease YncB( thermonuclease family)